MGRATRRRLGLVTLTAAASLGIAVPSPAPVAPGIPRCTGAGEIDYRCHEARSRAITRARGPGAAVRDLARRAARIGYVGAACHQLIHGIGRDAGRARGMAAFAEGDDSCASGYHHGVVEAVMARAGPQQAETVCAPLRARARHGAAHFNCAHGLGHGFMEAFGDDLPRALGACAALRDRWEGDHCARGAFMENLASVGRPRPSLDPRRPLYPCTAVARRFAHECFLEQTAYALYVHGDDFAAVFRLCDRVPARAGRASCRQGLGGDATVHASKFVRGRVAQRATTRALCRLGPSRAARRQCVTGAVALTVRQGGSTTSRPSALCAGFREPDLRRACSRAHLVAAREVAGRPGGAGEGPAALLCRRAEAVEGAPARQ